MRWWWNKEKTNSAECLWFKFDFYITSHSQHHRPSWKMMNLLGIPKRSHCVHEEKGANSIVTKKNVNINWELHVTQFKKSKDSPLCVKSQYNIDATASLRCLMNVLIWAHARLFSTNKTFKLSHGASNILIF